MSISSLNFQYQDNICQSWRLSWPNYELVLLVITTKNLGDFLSYFTTGDSNTNPYWKIERKKGRTISSLHLQCHNLSFSFSLTLKQWAFLWEALAFYTLPPANLAFFLLLLLNPCSCILAQGMQRQRGRTLLQWLLCAIRTQTKAFT